MEKKQYGKKSSRVRDAHPTEATEAGARRAPYGSQCAEAHPTLLLALIVFGNYPNGMNYAANVKAKNC